VPVPLPAPREDTPLSLRILEVPLDDVTLVDQAMDGDEHARDLLIERTTPVVYRFAMRMFGNEQDARDATQDTMVKLLRNLHRYDSQWRFQTWALGIARNTCIDEFRRRRRSSDQEPPDVADSGPDALELTSRRARAAAVHTALAAVPVLYREVLVLYHFEHMKYQEIADLLDIPIGTVMNRIFRARRKMREEYERNAGDAAVAEDGASHE
jgi:RNA polymerase sigma-70 factor, ECF subfamily